MVSIHAPAGGATNQSLKRTIYSLVSIHAPAGGATFKAHIVDTEAVFQSTRPRGARLMSNTEIFMSCQGFNPRARGGRDRKVQPKKMEYKMFQSTRPRGARPRVFLRWRGISLFQSTRPRGARHFEFCFYQYSYVVSIHAPAGGATFGIVIAFCRYREFQSTRPRGARPRNI